MNNSPPGKNHYSPHSPVIFPIYLVKPFHRSKHRYNHISCNCRPILQPAWGPTNVSEVSLLLLRSVFVVDQNVTIWSRQKEWNLIRGLETWRHTSHVIHMEIWHIRPLGIWAKVFIMTEAHIIVPGLCKDSLPDHPMLPRGELSKTPGYQASLSDGPQNIHIFWIRIHVIVFFPDWCIFPCSMIKEGSYKCNCGVCSMWKYLCEDGPWTYCLHLLERSCANKS